jgi:hypothetical protein
MYVLEHKVGGQGMPAFNKLLHPPPGATSSIEEHVV